MASLLTDLQKKISEAVAKDPKYLKRLKESPESVFEEVSKIHLDKNQHVKFHECDGDKLYINLPPKLETLREAKNKKNPLVKLYETQYISQEEAKKLGKENIEVGQYIATRANNDPEFYKKLKANPKAVLETLMDNPLPKETQVVLQEDSMDTLHLNYLTSQSELSESELRGISGGVSPLLIIPAVVWGGSAVGGAAGIADLF